MKQTVTRFAIRRGNQYLGKYFEWGTIWDAVLYDTKPFWLPEGDKIVQISVTYEELPYEVG